MKLCFSIRLLAGILFVVNAFGAADSPPRPPNLVFILIDDMGWADGSCFGSKFYQTPHMDALAAAGVRFTQAYAACAVCSPTRAALLTRKYPARLHITDWIAGEGAPKNVRFKIPDWQQHLPLEETTLAEALKKVGYVTAHIGKWHLGEKEFYPEHQGFDVNIAGGDIGHPASYFWPYGNTNNDHRVPGLAERGGQKSDCLTDQLTDEALNFIQANQDKPFYLNLCHYAVHAPLMLSCDYWPGHPDLITNFPPSVAAIKREYPNLPIYDGEKKFREEMSIDDLNHLTTWYAERAVKFIEKNKAHPFFLYVAHSMPHVPLGVSEKFRGKSACGLYGDVIEEIDWSVGQILDALKRNGLDENTWVIFTSDNGPWLSYENHAGSAKPLREGKGTSWEGGTREPCVMRWPGKIPAGADIGQTNNVAAMHPDIFAQLTAKAEKARADLGDSLTKNPGSRRREPGRLPQASSSN